MSKSVTIAICTRNRCDLLRQTLESLCAVVVPDAISTEVLVVANDCSDETLKVASAFATRLPLRTSIEPKPGLAHARNTAMNQAQGDWIAWTDDDVLLDTDWLVELLKATSAFPQAGIVGGFIHPWFPVEPDPILRSIFPHLDIGFCGHKDGPPAGPVDRHAPIWGANMVVRAAACRDLRFDGRIGNTPTSQIGGEDVWLRHRIMDRGYQAIWWPSMQVKHYVDPARMSLQYLASFTRSKGAESVLLNETGDRGAPPLWLHRRRLEARAYELISGLGLRIRPSGRLFSGPVPASLSRRSASLLWLRERLFLDGMLEAWRSARDGAVVKAASNEV